LSKVKAKGCGDVQFSFMKTILVPTDGSLAAEKALELALDLAHQHGADVKLLHVLLRDKEPDELMRLPELEGASEDIFGELKRLADGPKAARSAEDVMAARAMPERPAPESLLRAIGTHVLQRAETHAADAGITAEVLDLADGPAAELIAATADKTGADAIVMGTRGLRQIEAVAFGSVSQEVCRTASCTCVAVH
jgi:nucleotide-binding universal stress UspA family protein